MTSLRKAAMGALAALTLGGGVIAAPAASEAGWRGGYRWHAGYWYPGYGWGGGYGYGWSGPVAAGVTGAFAAPAYAYGPAYFGGGCCWQNRPVYDSWGNFAGFAPVQICY